ncbi:hypothetical protein [Persephonella sp.]
MGKISEETYLNELTHLIREKTGTNRFLSTKEISLIKKWYIEKIPLDELKKIIETEIKSFPISKRKKFSLLYIENRITKKKIAKEIKEITKDISQKNDKWKVFLEKNKFPLELMEIKDKEIDEELKDLEIEKRVVRYIWQNLPEKEKKRLQKETLEEIKRKFITENINLKKVLKSIIYRKIKKDYDFPE